MKRRAERAFAEAMTHTHGGGPLAALNGARPDAPKWFRDALAVVRGKALPCDFALPTKVLKGEVSYALVNVQYSKGGAPPAQTIYQDAACTGGEGWKYDDPAKPTRVVLCPKTCEAVRSDPKAKVDILLGCKTAIK